MILAETAEDRKKALAKLLPFQRERLRGHLQGHEGLPGHHPHSRPAAARVPAARRQGPGRNGQAKWAYRRKRSPSASRRCTSSTRCSASAAAGWASSIRRSPRCRPGPSSRRPATCRRQGIKVEPEIMIPLVGFLTELKAQAKIVHDTAKKVFAEKGVKVPYLVGTMIELPRACIVADQIAKEAEFFSFGTNDLTQTDPGHEPRRLRQLHPPLHGKRPGAARSVPDDRLRRRRRPDEARRRARAVQTRADLKIGICGEHGGDPDSRQVLPQDRAELCELQPLPRADRPPGGGAGGAGGPGQVRGTKHNSEPGASATGESRNMPFFPVADPPG